MAIFFILQEDAPSSPFNLLALLVMGGLALGLQGSAIHNYQRASGEMQSAWGAAGIGLVDFLVVIQTVSVMAVLIITEELFGPTNAMKYKQRAVTRFYEGEFDKAIEDFNQAIQLNAQDAQ
jgi:tetratricopeptide (TPR) repeat protein